MCSLVFGRHSGSRYLMCATASAFTCWDLLTLSRTWSLPLTRTSSLIACPTTSRVAVVNKDVVMMLNPVDKTVEARLETSRSIRRCTGPVALQWIKMDHFA